MKRPKQHRLSLAVCRVEQPGSHTLAVQANELQVRDICFKQAGHAAAARHGTRAARTCTAARSVLRSARRCLRMRAMLCSLIWLRKRMI